MLKRVYALILIIICIFTLSGCLDTESRRKNVGGKDVYELYIATASQEDTVTDIFMKKFSELVEEKSKGRIKMNQYPNSQLGGDIEITEAV